MARSRCPGNRGFTLVELLVVIVILGLLISIVMVGGSSVLRSGRIRETKAVLDSLMLACEQFKSDKVLARLPAYGRRYGGYPCDELGAFPRTGPGVGGGGPPVGPPTSDLFISYTNGLEDVQHRDIKAMALIIGLYSPTGTAILDRISERYVRALPDSAECLYFDDDENGTWSPPGEPTRTLVYYVDAWGQPIEYYATRAVSTGSDQFPNRVDFSFWLTKLNNGAPLFVSYGPDGPDQLEFVTTDVQSPLVVDFLDTPPPRIINHEFNDDNVYSSDHIQERLRKGSS